MKSHHCVGCGLPKIRFTRVIMLYRIIDVVDRCVMCACFIVWFGNEIEKEKMFVITSLNRFCGYVKKKKKESNVVLLSIFILP
jgi:hypothetical protein